MDDGVLKSSNRDTQREDVINAVKLIKEYPFTLELQMMTGLPVIPMKNLFIRQMK